MLKLAILILAATIRAQCIIDPSSIDTTRFTIQSCGRSNTTVQGFCSVDRACCIGTDGSCAKLVPVITTRTTTTTTTTTVQTTTTTTTVQTTSSSTTSVSTASTLTSSTVVRTSTITSNTSATSTPTSSTLPVDNQPAGLSAGIIVAIALFAFVVLVIAFTVCIYKFVLKSQKYGGHAGSGGKDAVMNMGSIESFSNQNAASADNYWLSEHPVNYSLPQPYQSSPHQNLGQATRYPTPFDNSDPQQPNSIENDVSWTSFSDNAASNGQYGNYYENTTSGPANGVNGFSQALNANGSNPGDAGLTGQDFQYGQDSGMGQGATGNYYHDAMNNSGYQGYENGMANPDPNSNFSRFINDQNYNTSYPIDTAIQAQAAGKMVSGPILGLAGKKRQ